ncbi:ABC transporter substrate-binding protein [Phytohabitans kaempferiae]|uniref:ABC transporter substrate-binding protein n=1 Tax=Phytohabitans kaempferiae TaxID=1620943 RepID=A0ABV6LXJ5_9ACTN
MSEFHLTRRAALRAALAAGGLLALPSCAAGGGGGEPSDAPSIGTSAEDHLREAGKKLGVSSISLLAYSAPQAEAIHQLTGQFTELTGIDVQWTALDEQSAANKAAVSLGSGAASYDVIHLTSGLLPTYASRDWLANLDQLRQSAGTVPGWDLAAYGQGATDLLRSKNALYAVPMFLGTQIFYYRTDVFEEHGIAAPPTSFTELRDVCEKVHGNGISAIALRSAPSPSQLLFVWSAWLYAFGGRYYDGYRDGTYSGVALDSPAAVQALDLYSGLLRDYAPTGATNWSVEDVTRSFTTGQVAMVQEGAVFGGTFNDPKGSQAAGKVGTFVIPSGTGGQFVPYNCHGWGVAKTSKQAEAAWLFVQWATLKVTLTAAAAGPVGFSTPPIADVYASAEYTAKYGFDDFVPSVTKTIEIANGGGVTPLEGDPNYLPSTPDWNRIGQKVSEQLSRAVTGQASAADAVKAAAAVIDA